MQAPTGVSGTHSLPNSGQSVGDGDAGHDVAADALLRQRRRRVVPQRRDVDAEAPPRVHVRPLVAQAQVAVGHVGDAAPAAAHRPEHPPELLLRGAVALAA